MLSPKASCFIPLSCTSLTHMSIHIGTVSSSLQHRLIGKRGRELEAGLESSASHFSWRWRAKCMGPNLPPNGRAEIYKRAGLSLQSFPGSAPEEIMSVRRAGSHPCLPSSSAHENLPSAWLLNGSRAARESGLSLCTTSACTMSMNHRCCTFSSKDWKEFSRAPKSFRVNGSWEPEQSLRSHVAPALLKPWGSLELVFL